MKRDWQVHDDCLIAIDELDKSDFHDQRGPKISGQIHFTR